MVEIVVESDAPHAVAVFIIPNDIIEQLKTAVVSACKLCFDFHNNCDTPCQVSFRRLDDRIEVEACPQGCVRRSIVTAQVRTQ